MTLATNQPDATHPLARFSGDLQAIIEGHAVVNRTPAHIWQDGLYLGNGDIAATAFGEPQHTRILLNKGDLWDERAEWLDGEYDPADFDWKRTKEVIARCIETGDWAPYRDLPRAGPVKKPDGPKHFPAFQAAGYLDILGDLPNGYGEFDQRLSLHKGRVDCRFSSNGKHYGYEAYTHADRNVLVVDVTTADAALWPLEIRLHRSLMPFRPAWKGDPMMETPQFGHDDGAMWMSMAFPDGFRYAVVVTVEGAEAEFRAGGGSVSARLSGVSDEPVRITATILTTEDLAGGPSYGGQRPGVVPQPASALIEWARTIFAELPDRRALSSAHQKWWADFWRKGWISLPDKWLENLWFVEIYKIASCSRKGGQAPGQLAHWNGFTDTPWRGDYHTNINVQENYWPIYTANRPELGWPFYDLYLGILDYMIEDTRKYTGQPGARYVRGHGRSGRPNGRGTDWEMWPGAGSWLCAHFWWHYQFTQDADFLRDCYRMFRACLDYFVAFLGEPDADGRYHIVPSLAHEQHVEPAIPGVGGGEFGKNSAYDLGILRDHLYRTIRASEILDVDAEERKRWRDILENLAPYPVSEQGNLQEFPGVDLIPSHRHLSPLYPIYPGEEITADAGAEWSEVGRKTVQRWIERGWDGYTGFSFGWLAACAARMGMAQEALDALTNHLRSFVNVNGYSLFGPAKVDALAPYPGRRTGPEWKIKLPNCESGGSFCAGINELVLRSPSGNVGSAPLIHVFPAIVDEWQDVRISRLRAQGAFLVTAERREGRTVYVILESEAGQRCRIVNPFGGLKAVVKERSGREVPFNLEGGAISFETRPGETYVLQPQGGDPADLPMVALGADDAAGSRLGVGGAIEKLELPGTNRVGRSW